MQSHQDSPKYMERYGEWLTEHPEMLAKAAERVKSAPSANPGWRELLVRKLAGLGPEIPENIILGSD